MAFRADYLDDRRQQIELAESLEQVLEIVEHGVPERVHSGACGPEAGCDGVCVELASIGETITRAHKVLKRWKDGQR